MKQTRKTISCGLVFSLIQVSIGIAQPRIGGRGDNYTFSDYYPAPHYTQMRYQLTGAEAQTLTNGLVALKQLRIVTFDVKGVRQLAIESPECIYDSKAREAYSGGRIQIEHGDDQLRMSGEGFRFRQFNASLLISNDVKALVRVQTNRTTKASSLMEITSRSFEFEYTNRHGVFRDKVHGEDEEKEFDAAELDIRGGANVGSFNTIEARGDVTFLVKSNGQRLAAQHCIYTHADDVARLEGDVSWSRGRMSGRADHLTLFNLMQKTAHNIEARGNVTMKLPREELSAAGGFISGAGKFSPARTDSPMIDVFTDRFISDPNQIQLLGSVRLDDGTNRLFCARIEAATAVEAAGETAVAYGDVVLNRGDANIRAERAAYTRSDGKIVFTGDPRWQSSQIEGSAQQLMANNVTKELFAQTNVTVRYKLAPGSASLFDFFPAGETTAANSSSTTIEIGARTFTAKESTREAVFAGGVRARQVPSTGIEPRLVSDSLVIRFAPAGEVRPEKFRARGNVVFEQGMNGQTNGPATYRVMRANSVTAQVGEAGALAGLVAEGDVGIHVPETEARCGRASYDAASQLLELTQNPTVDTPQLQIYEAERLVWDKARDSFRAVGPARTKLKAEGLKLEELQPGVQLPTLPQK